MTYNEYMEYTACNGIDCCNGTACGCTCCGWNLCNGTGSVGVMPTVTVGTVTPLRPGSTPTVTNTGVGANAVLNFGLPTITPSANLPNLAATASSTETVQTVNQILDALRTAGILA